MTTAALPAPFPAFGGKSRAAHLVWQRFGNVDSYIEPFAFSAAVLFGRPAAHLTTRRVETINDLYCPVCGEGYFSARGLAVHVGKAHREGR
jgi:hypothetical protein